MDDDYIADVFGAHGVLAQSRPDYQPRDGQITLARAVDGAIRDTAHVLIEAPTGTGKTIGYAVPAIYHAVRSEKRVLIVTANLALQHQIVHEDLPTLQKTLSWPFAFTLIKGRSNYVCIDRVKEEREADRPWREEDADDAHDVMDWSEETETGDISELSYELPKAVRARLTVSADDCDGSRCPYYEHCYAEKAKVRAKKAQIIVTNYHMLFSHILSGDRVLPRFDVAILDEAHAAPDIARESFGFDVLPGSIAYAVRFLREMKMSTHAEAIIRIGEEFFAGLTALLDKARERGISQLRLTGTVNVDWATLYDGLVHVAAAYLSQSREEERPEDALRWTRAAEVTARIGNRIRDAMTLKYPSFVYMIQQDESKRTVLSGRPLDVAPILREGLFRSDRAVILTSATLRTYERFSYIREEMGLNNKDKIVVECVVMTPFNWKDQASSSFRRTAPRCRCPKTRASTRRSSSACASRSSRRRGRTLCLFTSWKRLLYVKNRLGDVGYRVLSQGDMERSLLIEEFRKDVSSVLLGTGSFWAGIDIPGEALSCLVIDKLPFESEDDPIAAAFGELHKDAFIRRTVPRAIVSLNQGLGRLIRRTTDKGVIVLLDKRFHHKGYGVLFRRSLPPGLRVVESMAAIGEFLSAAKISETH